VVRAAWGLYTDRIYQIMFTGNISNVPFSVGSSTANAPFLLSASAPVAPVGSVPAVTTVDPNLRNPSTQRFNVAVEQKLTANSTITAAWVAARARDLVRNADVNGGAGVPTDLRPDPRFGRQRMILNGAESRYDSLQVFARRRFAHGLDLTGAYTFAKSTDNISTEISFGETIPWLLNMGANPTAAGVQGGGAQFVPRSFDVDRGPSSFDVRHTVAFSHVLELPFGRGRRWLRTNALLDAIAGGWNLSGIVSIRSGLPFTPTLGVDVNDDGDASTDRPALLGGASLNALYNPGGGTQWLVSQNAARELLGVPADVTRPELAIGRNSFRGPWLQQYDLSLQKRVQVTESVTFGIEANAFNLFNHANFDVPVANLSSAFFGRISNATFGSNARQIQIGARVSF
jgi:hypothetical protein